MDLLEPFQTQRLTRFNAGQSPYLVLAPLPRGDGAAHPEYVHMQRAFRHVVGARLAAVLDARCAPAYPDATSQLVDWPGQEHRLESGLVLQCHLY